MTPHDMPYRALFRQENGDPNPPDLGKIASVGTLTSSRKRDPVIEARKASLFLIGGAEKPGVSCGISICHPRLFPTRERLNHLFNQEPSNLPLFSFLRYLSCPNHCQICHRSVRYPSFTPIQSPPIRGLSRSRLHRGRIGAMVRLCQSLNRLSVSVVLVAGLLTKHPTISPEATFPIHQLTDLTLHTNSPRRGKYFSFCSSVPNYAILSDPLDTRRPISGN